MSEQQQQPQFDDTERENFHITTLSSFESPPSHPSPSPPYRHLVLGDLSHLQQPAPSQHHYQQQQRQQKRQSSSPYLSRDEEVDENEEEDGEEDSSSTGSDKNRLNSPFSPHCRIPLPDFTFGFNGANGGLLLQSHLDTGTFIRRRNERERTRVRNVNEGFERLRAHLPPLFSPAGSSASSLVGGRNSSREREGRKSNSATSSAESRRLSKVETLRLAIAYIKQLQEALRS